MYCSCRRCSSPRCIRGSGAVVVNIRVRRKERGFVHATFMGLVAARVRTALARAVVHGVARARSACATRVRAAAACAVVPGVARARGACATRLRAAAAVAAVAGAASSRDACATHVRAALSCAEVVYLACALLCLQTRACVHVHVHTCAHTCARFALRVLLLCPLRPFVDILQKECGFPKSTHC